MATPPTAAETRKFCFRVRRGTHWGENLFIVGSVPELGAWDTRHAQPMHYESATTWSATLELPAGATVEYKYIVAGENPEHVREWEHGGNRVRTLDAGRLRRACFIDTFDRTDEVSLASPPMSPLEMEKRRNEEYQSFRRSLRESQGSMNGFTL